MSEYNPIYNYVDIVQDIEEDSNKPKKEYIGIIEVRKVGTQIKHYYIGGIIRASDDHTAYLLSKRYCHKIADYLVNMTCEPYEVITTEVAMKTTTIMRIIQQHYAQTAIKIDGVNVTFFVLGTEDFPDLKSTEKIQMPLIEALIRYPYLMKKIRWMKKDIINN